MKKLFLIFLSLSCVGFVGLYYYWRQATQLPEWYTNESSNTQQTLDLDNTEELIAAKARLQAKVEASIAKSQATAPENLLPLAPQTENPINSLRKDTDNLTPQVSQNKNVEIELSDQDVNELVATTLAEQLAPSKVLNTIGQNRTIIKDGILESGAIVNLANLPKNQLSESENATLGKVLKTFPFLADKNIYIGIVGKPRIEDGKVKLDKHTKVKLGNLTLSLSELQKRLGISQEELEQNLNLSLQVGRLKVSNLELTDNKALLKGSVE